VPALIMTARWTLIAVAGAAALAGCEAREKPDARLCTPFTQAATPAPGTVAPAADPAGPLDSCLHRWSYALARSSDAADVVAAAAVAACGPTLGAWNRQSIQPGPDGQQGPTEAMSLTTGQPVNVFAAHHEFAENRALFWVVQARAGKCAAPPMTNGTLSAAAS
jgi:hypothetical protein